MGNDWTVSPRIVAYMLSCEVREAIRRETLAALRKTDWDVEPVVVLDRGEHPDGRRRQVLTARRLLDQALAAGEWDYLLFLEDDLAWNVHLKHNLHRWWPLRVGRIHLASLYNPGVTLLVQGPNCAAADPDTVYGSQAMLLSRRCASYIGEHFHEGEGMQDIIFSRLGGRLAPIYYHVPSLVQHIGAASVWGGEFHQASDFDPAFRA